MRRFLKNPGGKQLSTTEAKASHLASEHIFCGPERPKANKRHGNMHGLAARSNPHYGYEGILPTMSQERTVHVNDIAVLSSSAGEADNSAAGICRVLQKFWDGGKDQMVLLVRLFVSVDKVADDPLGSAYLEAYGVRYLRLWEPESRDGSVTKTVGTGEILDLCEIYPEAEVKSRQRKMPEWREGKRVPEAQPFACVGVAFVAKARIGAPGRGGKRKEPGGASATASTKYNTTDSWSPEGTEDDPLFTIRDPSYFHNVSSRPFVGVPLVYNIDGFNAHQMETKKTVGGPYFGWAWNSLGLQRRKRETHVGTVASPGASCEGEMILQCSIVRELQRGCITTASVPATDGSCKELEVR